LKISNKHELLFWNKSPSYNARLMHLILIFEMVWMVTFCVRYYDKMRVVEEYICGILGIIITVFNLIYFIPYNMRVLAITSNIQMLKDKKLIREVLDEKAKLKMECLARLYRLLKSAVREMRDSVKSKALKAFIVNQLREYYRMVDKDETNALPLSKLPEILHHCGGHLRKDEALYFAKLCAFNLDDPVPFDTLSVAVEKFTDDVSQDPYEICKYALERLAPTRQHYLTPKQLESIMREYGLIEERDMEVILNEVQYLPQNNAEIEIDMIARLIRDSIEGLAR